MPGSGFTGTRAGGEAGKELISSEKGRWCAAVGQSQRSNGLLLNERAARYAGGPLSDLIVFMSFLRCQWAIGNPLRIRWNPLHILSGRFCSSARCSSVRRSSIRRSSIRCSSTGTVRNICPRVGCTGIIFISTRVFLRLIRPFASTLAISCGIACAAAVLLARVFPVPCVGTYAVFPASSLAVIR